ncbi:single-stranded DNA-binding protein [Curtobacterium sp. CFBP9011]|uniref:single-stranded DNA-binding protein n=1 Tax=Curtobacterium sp. CFBP9011 TaxID=3096530 RepID=UPI002A6AC3F5|nr:single-stranded DNA-binding protein [Curtobacterium sp. CFBP9011]MDY1005726.1 single-stranded DNA-binding protein [Curtobacterium sp. CFBP9011]
MSKGTMTVEGFVANEPSLNRTNSGKSVISVTVPHQRSKRQEDGTWERQGETTWVEAAFWEDQADLIAQQVAKGTAVILTGDPEVQVYAKRDGTAGAKVVLRFPTLGIVPRVQRQQQGSQPVQYQQPSGQQPQQGQSQQGGAQGQDVWSQQGGFDDETPF